MMNHGSMRGVLLAAAFALTACGVSIAAEQGERTYRSTPDGEGSLTQEMIEQCITLDREISKSHAEFQKLEAQHTVVAKAADEIAAALKAFDAEKSWDQRDSKELTDFNYNGRIADYKAKLAEAKKLYDEMQAKKAVYDQQNATLERQCKDQPYYEDDNAAAVKKMGRSM